MGSLKANWFDRLKIQEDHSVENEYTVDELTVIRSTQVQTRPDRSLAGVKGVVLSGSGGTTARIT